MEKALYAAANYVEPEHLHDFTLMHEYPLTKNMLAVSHIWKNPQNQELYIASK
jgi:Ca2+-transporting ATPase